MAMEDDHRPLGQRLRDLINPALEDERAKPVQAEIVSNVFSQIADNVPFMFEREFSKFFNHVATKSEKKPQIKNPMIVTALTQVANPQEGEAAFYPIKKLQLPVSTAFTTFTADEIREMPGWVKLHEVCRDMDISIKIMALTQDESKGSLLPPLLILDASKSYNEGAIENSQFYPNLKEKPAEFDKKGGQEFHF
jgi:hypothetical protein